MEKLLLTIKILLSSLYYILLDILSIKLIILLFLIYLLYKWVLSNILAINVFLVLHFISTNIMFKYEKY